MHVQIMQHFISLCQFLISLGAQQNDVNACVLCRELIVIIGEYPVRTRPVYIKLVYYIQV